MAKMPSSLRANAPPYVPLAVRMEPTMDANSLLELPYEVLSLVLANMKTSGELMTAGLTCKALMSELASAPVSVCISSKTTSALSSCEAACYIAGFSSSVLKYLPGITSLDLSNVPVEDKEVLSFGTLPRLRVLNLSGCKKLTPQLCDELASTPVLNLQALNLQRCFQLNSSCLHSILSACAKGSLALRCLAMSHLDMRHLGQQLSSTCWLYNRSTLQVLALNNCAQLTTSAILSVTSSSPNLTHLFLGGSSFLASELDASKLDLPGILQSMPSLPEEPGYLVSAVQAAVNSYCAMQSVKGSPSFAPSIAAILTILALMLPNLKALELTCMPPPVVAAVRHALEHVCKGRAIPEVWDLAQESGVEAAVAALRLARQRSVFAPSCSQHPQPSDLALALTCAVNCSSSTRTTPLHVAAFSGASSVAEKLVQLGAMVDARDVGGATAMFLAAEAGRAAAVSKLLDAGGDPCISNAAGESPLYIASLKGHLEVVRALVQGFMQRNVAWHQLRYGDGWTPLMAAAVANHYNVAHWLLIAAGTEAALELIKATNRYRQSVLHIAARKGSLQMLRLLLGSGGASTLAVPDASGETPVDVAIKHSHAAAIAEFRRVCALA